MDPLVLKWIQWMDPIVLEWSLNISTVPEVLNGSTGPEMDPMVQEWIHSSPPLPRRRAWCKVGTTLVEVYSVTLNLPPLPRRSV